MLGFPLSMRPSFQILSQLRIELFWVITQSVMVTSNRRFGTAYRSPSQGPIFLYPEDGTETSVRNYHYWLRNSPEERSSQLLHGGGLKSCFETADWFFNKDDTKYVPKKVVMQTWPTHKFVRWGRGKTSLVKDPEVVIDNR